MGRADVHPRADFSTLRPLNTTIRVEELLEMGGRGLYAETAQSALTVIFKLVISCPTIVILVILGTINLQFQSFHFFEVSSWNCGSSCLGTVWSSCSEHLPPGGSFSIYKTAHRICSEYY